MRLRTVSILICMILLGVQQGKAQYIVTNPLEWLALAEGNEAINSEIESQIEGQAKTAVLQNTIAAEFNKIHEWERKYSGYLRTASVYEDGVRIFITLGKLSKAIRNNPQGIVATMSMNNLYIETATELVTVFTLLRNAIATGGDTNMLTGSERSETLWILNDRLGTFHKKLSRLYLSIRYYTLNDVWNNVTAGMLDRDYGDIAHIAFDRWRRGARVIGH